MEIIHLVYINFLNGRGSIGYNKYDNMIQCNTSSLNLPIKCNENPTPMINGILLTQKQFMKLMVLRYVIVVRNKQKIKICFK